MRSENRHKNKFMKTAEFVWESYKELYPEKLCGDIKLIIDKMK